MRCSHKYKLSGIVKFWTGLEQTGINLNFHGVICNFPAGQLTKIKEEKGREMQTISLI